LRSSGPAPCGSAPFGLAPFGLALGVFVMAGAVSDPQTLARDLIAENEHPVLGTVRQIRSPLRVDGRLTELRSAPRRGEHTREVLVAQCGYADADVDRLAETGVFGDVVV